MSETIAVRHEEELPLERLEPYLRAQLAGAEGPLSIRQFGGGHANLTYLLRFGEREFVLRRPPHGPLPAGAHDMQREYRVLSRLHRSFALAPRAYLLCTDPALIGADFVVMERRTGLALRGELPEPLAGDGALQRRLGKRFVETLVQLHAVDYQAAELADLGRPEGYLRRQVEGWSARWTAADSPERPEASGVIAWLLQRMPGERAPAIVHNDYKLDNVLVAPNDLARVVAVLDWDMCTLGDPLADLGYLLALWSQAEDPTSWWLGAMPTRAGGFPRRRELVERYARKSGRDCAAIGWYYVFNVFRYAVIGQQIYVRFLRGQTHDERFAHFGRHVSAGIERAHALIGEPQQGLG
ncbi:MAG: phosphotransferase family protein [Vulcanimicrobiaceae bacterium]